MPLDFTPCVAEPKLRELGIHKDTYAFDFAEVSRDLQDCYDDEGYLVNETRFYDTVRDLSKADLFFLLYFVLDLPVNDPFLVARCYEIQNSYDNSMNLWARGFFKSTIITHGLPLFLLINDPERRICIFSHTRNIAKDHMRRSKTAMETNHALKMAHTDIFYEKPESQAPKWNEDIGCFVKRKRAYIEASLEAWGLVDFLPTGKHFTHSIYDDVIDLKKVSTPEQIKKATFYFRSSLLLRARKHEKIIAGTRYDNGDTYSEEMKKKKWVERIYPSEVDDEGKYRRGGIPIYLTRDELEEYYNEHGEYIYNCLEGKTKILMADYSIKNIEDIKIGDKVIGLEKGNKNKKCKLIETTVLHHWIYKKQKTVKLILEDGNEIICTPDHKWWTGRWPTKTDNRKVYSPAGFVHGKVSKLSKILDFNKISRKNYTEDQLRAWDYLAGFFDGEGTVSGGTLNLCQSRTAHPEICKKVEEIFDKLNIKYNRYEYRSGVLSWQLRGGRQLAFEFVNMTETAKRQHVIDRLFNYSSRINAKGGKSKIKIKQIYPYKKVDVHSIETGTGNYIANGYVSSNCQMGQYPMGEAFERMKREWLHNSFYDPNSQMKKPDMYLYGLVDAARKQEKRSDYTAMGVLGSDCLRNIWLLDLVRDKMDNGQKWDAMKRLTLKWGVIDWGYEHVGLASDREYMELRMQEDGCFFRIIELGGNAIKPARIKRLIPDLQRGRWKFPKEILYQDVQGNIHELMNEFLTEEYDVFPYAAHDDILDMMSRIYDGKMNLNFPPLEEVVPDLKPPRPDPLGLREPRNPEYNWMAEA